MSLANELGCVRQDTIIIHVDALPQVNLGNDTTLCSRQILALHAGNPGDSVNWFSAREGLLVQDTMQQWELLALQTDTLWAAVWNARECVSYDTLIVTVTPLPETEAGADRLICRGDTSLLGVLAVN